MNITLAFLNDRDFNSYRIAHEAYEQICYDFGTLDYGDCLINGRYALTCAFDTDKEDRFTGNCVIWLTDESSNHKELDRITTKGDTGYDVKECVKIIIERNFDLFGKDAEVTPNKESYKDKPKESIQYEH